MQNIDGGIYITVMEDATGVTCPDPIRQRQGGHLSTLVAGFRGRKEAPHRDNLSAVPIRFVAQHLYEATQGGITERFGQFGFHKAFNVQGFDAHRIELSNDP